MNRQKAEILKSIPPNTQCCNNCTHFKFGFEFKMSDIPNWAGVCMLIRQSLHIHRRCDTCLFALGNAQYSKYEYNEHERKLADIFHFIFSIESIKYNLKEIRSNGEGYIDIDLNIEIYKELFLESATDHLSKPEPTDGRIKFITDYILLNRGFTSIDFNFGREKFINYKQGGKMCFIGERDE